MNTRIASFALVTLGLLVACGSSPPAAPPASPGAPGTPGTPGTPGSPASDPATGATGDLSKPGPAASAAAAQATTQDLSTCMQNIDPTTTQDCIDCMTGSCSAQMKSAGAHCPAFSNCICNGGAMQSCAPMINDPVCKDAFTAVGTCKKQSCSSKCMSASASGAPGGGPVPVPGGGAPGGMQPATGGADSCPSLKACCDQLPPQATKACSGAVAKNNANACAMTLQALKGAGMCH
jgi:hypothetical protein